MANGGRRTGERTDKADGVDNAAFVACLSVPKSKRKPQPVLGPSVGISAVEASFTMPLEEGLKRERELFGECLRYPASAARGVACVLTEGLAIEDR